MPHATSKLQSFADIGTSFGFRGEALFCIRHLSANVVIATRTADEQVAQKLTYHRDGSLATTCAMTRSVGTTVAVVSFLDALAVRRADLLRRIQPQRAKLVATLQQYGIFCVGVRLHLMDIISCNNAKEEQGGGGSNNTNTNATSERTLLLTSDKATTLQETTSSVMGSQFVSQMCTVHLDLTEIMNKNGSTTRNTNNEQASSIAQFKLEGLITKASVAVSGKPKQYFAINGRPVDLPKVAKLINGIWKSLGLNNKPCCVLQFQLPIDSFDINIEPSKRAVIFCMEGPLMKAVETYVTDLWTSQTSGKFVLVAANNTNKKDVASKQQQQQQPFSEAGALNAAIAAAEGLRNKKDSDDDDDDDDDDEPTEVILSPTRFQRRYAFASDTSRLSLQHEYDDGRTKVDPRQERLRTLSILREHAPDLDFDISDDSSNNDDDDEEHNDIARRQMYEEKKQNDSVESTQSYKSADESEQVTVTPLSNTATPVALNPSGFLSSAAMRPTSLQIQQYKHVQRSFNSNDNDDYEHMDYQVQQSDVRGTERDSRPFFERFRAASQGQNTLDRYGFSSTSLQPTAAAAVETPSVVNNLSLDYETDELHSAKRLRAETTAVRLLQKHESDTSTQESSRPSSPLLASKELQTLPDESTTEREPIYWNSFKGTTDVVLQARRDRIAMRDEKRKYQARECCFPHNEETNSVMDATKIISLQKDDFATMKVLGQFNLGFVLACTTPDNNLWILDQHACDEKYTFEKLFAETVIHEQALIAPMPLELTPAEETCVMDHMELFEKNGFRFLVDLEKPPRHRLALTGLPHSGARNGRKAVQFGKEDVSALCSILGVEDTSSSHDGGAGSGTGTDGTGAFGNNAVRRYAGSLGKDTAEKIIVRLPKAIAMFASRACRTSIMIGKALSHTEMDRIVKRLKDVEQPWNCPHGRPTMRHVSDLHSLLLQDEQQARERIAGATVTMASQPEEQVESYE
jgi:DNA mismatch repair protein PMS2